MNVRTPDTARSHRGHDTRDSLIFLAGFMGSGKSTVGPILANTLGYDFLDVDRRVEELEGMTVVEIFRSKGEQYFRSRERDVLREVVERSACVVSLGGGTISTAEHLVFIQQHGIIVYLELSEEEILKRVIHRPDRPLLHDTKGGLLPPDQLKEKIGALYAAREPFYRQADIVIPSHQRRVGLTVDAIVKALRKHK